MNTNKFSWLFTDFASSEIGRVEVLEAIMFLVQYYFVFGLKLFLLFQYLQKLLL